MGIYQEPGGFSEDWEILDLSFVSSMWMLRIFSAFGTCTAFRAGKHYNPNFVIRLIDICGKPSLNVQGVLADRYIQVV